MMSLISFQPMKAPPYHYPLKGRTTSSICCAQKLPFNANPKQTYISRKPTLDAINYFGTNNKLLIQVGLFATVVEPAIAVTGVNSEPDWPWVLIQVGAISFWYFLIMPPIIMNWLRIRWYRRNLIEMYFQFMFVFMFFPGLLLWAPFLNFRKFPRDPTMKYPWSKPENPSEVKGSFLKYPWASIEDYEY